MKNNALKPKDESPAKSMALGNDDDEDGGERSQTYYITKAAQKHGELQREGDELDPKDFRTGFQRTVGRASQLFATGATRHPCGEPVVRPCRLLRVRGKFKDAP